MKILIVAVAALCTIALLFRDCFSVRARWVYGGLCLGGGWVVLALTRSWPLCGVAECLVAASMLLHLKIAHNIKV